MNRRHLLAATVAAAALLAGCASPITHVASGTVTVRERLLVDVADSWNQFGSGEFAKTPTWTNEGIFVDALTFYVGLKDGELLAPTPSEPKGVAPLTFKAGMQPAEVVELFQKMWSRGGSTVTVDRIEPGPFLGGDGYRFEYTIVRKIDEVRLQGVAWAAVRNGELHAITYSAPKLAFFARYRPRVEVIAKSARLRG